MGEQLLLAKIVVPRGFLVFSNYYCFGDLSGCIIYMFSQSLDIL